MRRRLNSRGAGSLTVVVGFGGSARIEMGKLSKKSSGESGSTLKKRKRPAGARKSQDAVWGNSLAWKNVTPNDPLSILVGSDEGGFMSLEEIDGDIFVGTTEEGGVLGAIPEANEKPRKKIKKKTKKELDPKKAVESSELDEVLTLPSERDEATVPSDGGTSGLLSQSNPKKEKRKQKKKEKKEKKLKVGKNAEVDGSSCVEKSDATENNSIEVVTPSKKKSSKVENKSFVIGPVINTVAGDTDGSAPKDVREGVTDIETRNSKDSTPVLKGTLKNIKEDGSGKKVKLGSKARRLLRLQKQQKLHEQNGVNGKQGPVKEDGISEDDLRKREDMEIERLENSPSSEVDEIEEIDMSAWSQLRLHPLLMRALMKLKFLKPTHIQEKCIAAAAYQGKDVIGAAETGSGKTLAFGLPILQRLLDDHEKIQRKSDFDKASKKQSGGPLRALIVTPTRELALQVCDHLRAAAQFTNFNVVPIVGGMALQKQQRFLRYQPQIVVGTPGRLWELMSAGESHLLDLAQLSFFVLDEADRMVERGHFKELQSIMDMLPKTGHEPAADNEKPPQRRKRRREAPKENKEEERGDDAEEEEDVQVYPDSDDDNAEETSSENEIEDEDEDEEGDEDEDGDEGVEDGDEEQDVDSELGDEDRQPSAEDTTMEEDFSETTVVEPVKKRQTLVFSATLSLPSGFKKKLKRGFFTDKSTSKKNEYSVASLIQRAAMKGNAVIIDLTTKEILARKLEESVIECRDEEKDAYLYYILKVHGCGRTLVFCTSIAALRHVTAMLRLLQVSVWPLHAQMQQKQRLKAMDRFKASDDCVMIATDVAARGLDVTGIRTVIHYQLPHSAEMYVHRSGRTARADTDGCSIAIISPSDRAKYNTLCRNLDKENGLPSFPIDLAYFPAVVKRVSLAFQVDKVLRKHQQFKAKQSWVKRNAEALELDVENSEDDDDEASVKMPVEKRELMKVQALQQELQMLLKQPLEPKAFSRRYVTGSGVTPVLAKQLKEYTASKLATKTSKKGSKTPVSTVNNASSKSRLLVIGQEAVEPLDALRRSALLQTSSKPIPVATPKSEGVTGDSKANGSSSGPKSKRRRR